MKKIKYSHIRRADAIFAHKTYAQLVTVIFFQYYTNAVHISSCYSARFDSYFASEQTNVVKKKNETLKKERRREIYVVSSLWARTKRNKNEKKLKKKKK